ncbi:uncharacterized protein LOC118645588 [Monomorium pharaonis]|uniref:uncharacterized protein LOC118645588 n=1 Tax=Monomorium pharaonis TaxID=307658 RepID=UPI00174659B2|nr:uncharacterized protein LOC118645588 [Monomorium pharaonis]
MDALITSQTELYGRIARAIDNLKKLGSANITMGVVEARIKALDSTWSKFESQHDTLTLKFPGELGKSSYARDNLFDQAEMIYITQRGALMDWIADFQRASRSTAVEASTAPPERNHLPRINLPQFSGAVEDWFSFRALFLSVINKQSTISNVEKLHYLRTSLRGEADKLVRDLPVTGDNFERAWNTLSEYYENKRVLARANFASFTALPKLKSELAGELRRIFQGMTSTVNTQESIGRPIAANGMDLFVHLVVELLDARTRRDWESAISSTAEPPSYDELRIFLMEKIRTLEALAPAKVGTEGPASATKTSTPRAAKSHHVKQGPGVGGCAYCKGSHFVMSCSEFRAKTPSERLAITATHKLCTNCLGNYALAKCPSTKTCILCNAKHHSLLHGAPATTPPAMSGATSLAATRRDEDHRAILLATARLKVNDIHGLPHDVRALIDQGSEVSIISEALAQRLRLRRTKTAFTIFGVGPSSSHARGKVTLQLMSAVTGAKVSAVAVVLPRLSLYRDKTDRRSTSWPHLRGLPLADPEFMANDPVELLLGAEVYSNILEDGLCRGSPSAPIAQCTVLGWIVSGGVSSATGGSPISCQCTVDQELTRLVHQFWEQEAEPRRPATLTPAEQQCEDLFLRTHSRAPSGRYMVRLPLRGQPARLSETRRPAERILSAMEGKCAHSDQFGELYRAFMREYEDLQHMTEVPPAVEGRAVCYLPHHGVLRRVGSTAKLRVVFNGSQVLRDGESLNSLLLVGANLLPALADVILRWRWHRFVVVSDVEKMYRQILVRPDDRDYQRILWRRSANTDVREFQLNTVTYGLACAPFLAIRTLRQLASDEQQRFPKGASALRRDCYVDDILTGASTISDAIAIQQQVRGLCMAGGFPLRKWATNKEEVLDGVPPEHRLQRSDLAWEPEWHSTLGLRWHPAEDCFSIKLNPSNITRFTKRTVLAETARLFDPLGWLAPVVARAKILIQSAWLQQLDWDAPLHSAEAKEWRTFFEELPLLRDIRVRRWLGSDIDGACVEIHGFSDASERGFAAVVYLRGTDRHGLSLSFLLAARTRVAPVKQVSLPRLELCAAALLVRLTHHVQDTLGLTTAPTHLWCDSTVVLHWIRGHPSRWKTYVANRVSHIQQRLPNATWRHIPGKDNPADCASRGVSPRDMPRHALWWTGPPWLIEPAASWPSEPIAGPDCSLPEQRAVASAATLAVVAEPDLLLRFSSWTRLLRVTSWCLRWRGSKMKRTDPFLHAEEIKDAERRWFRITQQLHYAAEIAAMKREGPLPHRSQLANLHPFRGPDGILRVGGRLKHSLLAYDEKHPIIVPPASQLTKLLVEHHHRRTLHGGVQLTLAAVRQAHWIPQGRSVVKGVINRCNTCVRWRAAAPQPPMGDLPASRVTPARPFSRVGVDYAGPILMRTTKGRGHKAHKAFIAVFVCMSTRAIHIEAVSDYSAEAFLAAFRRFVSRRGLPSDVFSDCGTNFTGADRQLRILFSASAPDGRHVADRAATLGIRWHFNPPSAPHFGGIWEAAVKSMKHHLRRVIGDATLTFEEMSTFLAQVEACLNSRPLQAQSDDPTDFGALTPGHALTGAPLIAVQEPLSDAAASPGTRWQHLQKMRDHFWQRWSHEYLQGLTARSKWLKSTQAPQMGALCLIKSETSLPTKWPLARIVEMHPGTDGIVRVVTVRTATTELVRPLVKIVLLPGANENLGPANDQH